MIKNIKTYNQDDIEIKVIRNKCIGAATCIVYAEDTFDLDQENIAIVKDKKWDRLEKIIAAAQSCPVVAIEVYQKGVKVYPKD